MTTTTIQQTSTLAARVLGPVAGNASCVLQRATAGYRHWATRRQLENLSLEQLADVGIDPDAISRGHETPGDPWTMIRLMSLR